MTMTGTERENLEMRFGGVETRLGGVETQVADMNERLIRLEVTVEYILENMATKADISDLRAEMAEKHTELLKWMIGAVLGGMAVASTLTFALARLFGS